MEVDHNGHRVKLHYNNWGSNYDEWFVYKAQSASGTASSTSTANATATNNINNDNNNNSNNTNRSRSRPRCTTLSQQDLLHRIVRHQSITGRKALRQPFKDKAEAFK